MASVETVIFDMDGVVSRYDRPRRLEILAEGTGIEAAEIERRIWASGFDARADEGAYTAAEYMAEFSRLLGVPVSTELWLEARGAGMAPDREVLKLAEEVGRRATIAMLTNNGPVLLEHLDSVAPEVLAVFGERAFFSCQFGTGKDHPEVFGLLLAEVGGAPASTLFIDDTPEYLENGRTAGLYTHHFSGIDRLRAELHQYELI